MYWRGIVFQRMAGKRLAETGTCGSSTTDNSADSMQWNHVVEAELKQAQEEA